MFNETVYSLHSQGIDSSGQYVQTYRSNEDGNYQMKKIYLDSSYNDMISKSFLKSNVPEGPINIFSRGQLSLKGAYKNGKWDGERLTYRNGIILQKAYFIEGVKTGTWEESNTQGQLNRKITYDSAGKVVTDVRY
jgi:antitoxin component YwqK of YwqJK toxin-antitoxin module